FLGTAIQIAHAHNAATAMGQKSSRNCRHTGGKPQGRFCVLQPGQPLLQVLNARVGAPAGVQVAVASPLNHIQQVCRVFKPVGGGVVNRRVGAAEGILVAAIVDDAGSGALVVWGGHGGSYAFGGRRVSCIVDCCVS